MIRKTSEAVFRKYSTKEAQASIRVDISQLSLFPLGGNSAAPIGESNHKYVLLHGIAIVGDRASGISCATQDERERFG